MKNATPVIRKEIMNESRFAPVKVRDLKKRSDTIGRSVFVSTTMNAMVRIADATNASRIAESVQPRSPAWINAQVRDAIAPVISTVPGMSVATSPEVSRDSRTTACVTSKATIPIGTLIRKIQCQVKYSTIAPPITGPSAILETEMALQSPSALPRSSGGNAAEINESESGMMNAAPRPCKARIKISASVELTNAAANEVAVKSAMPIMNHFLRPNRSPNPPAVICSEAKTSVYAETIHCNWLVLASRSRCMVGSATLTTRLSSIAIKSAKQEAAKVNHFALSLLTRPERNPCANAFSLLAAPLPPAPLSGAGA